jgi:hypothetical protein
MLKTTTQIVDNRVVKTERLLTFSEALKTPGVYYMVCSPVDPTPWSKDNYLVVLGQTTGPERPNAHFALSSSTGFKPGTLNPLFMDERPNLRFRKLNATLGLNITINE